MKEIWKPIKGYEGYYEISNFGVVKSLSRIVKRANHVITIPECIKSIYISKKGYPVVTLCKNKKSIGKYLHVLLAEAFIPNPENKPYVDHINTNKLDYRLCNLRWVTAKENTNNPLTFSRIKTANSSKEFKYNNLLIRKQHKTKTGPKAVYQYTLDGKFIKSYFSIRDASRENNISPSAIGKALLKNKPKVKNFLWSSKYKKILDLN